jgi:ectoine hydroxylase-related dioxygenase (phytanoyl-CoA dioxygenase family)
MISVQDRNLFLESGVLFLKGFLPSERVLFAHQAALSALSLPHNRSITKHLQANREILSLIGAEVCSPINDLLDGRAFSPLTESVSVLFTPPNAEHWTVPHQNWHIDVPCLPQYGTLGVQVFTFLDRVAPTGGGTLVVEGSHRLVNEGKRIHSQDVKKALKQEAYFRELMSGEAGVRLHFLKEPALLNGVRLQVRELHGEPGDVYFTDLRLLHTLAPNATKSPRMMLTQRYILDGLREALFPKGDAIG